MLFQDLNGNFQFGEANHGSANHYHRPMPSFYEGRHTNNVPDINLECDETIDNWDEFESSIYSKDRNQKFHGYNERSSEGDIIDESFEFYNDFPPPNSPTKGLQVEQPVLQLHSQYVSSLLQAWRDSQTTKESNRSSDGFSLPSDDPESSQESYECQEEHSLGFDYEMVSENEANQEALNSNSNLQDRNSSDLSSSIQLAQQPVSHSSSRSNSPTVMEMLTHFRRNIINFRSISPVIVRSPSPISSRSSSPRFVRSPSPLEFLEHSLSSLPLDDSTELVFYEDRYIVRSYSPVSSSQRDHQVPDVNMDFQQTVSDSEEFPSFRTYTRRIQNSCLDQVVPDYIEE
ncbi:uncharacterized protein LOC132738329 [Ruditapes philippinarum]|uniref:uncharacterized protein LOC132738329 n=1 Tax=Ruditapes philippinarum TaxID=129788 RepID=UPI00295A9E44|nr:uncharacterized protein LOC132738329 [Ruditapes philippinarum]XP_060581794.1 uncharacterized protein LOC132738329 [Ruditapes philippinarum]